MEIELGAIDDDRVAGIVATLVDKRNTNEIRQTVSIQQITDIYDECSHVTCVCVFVCDGLT